VSAAGTWLRRRRRLAAWTAAVAAVLGALALPAQGTFSTTRTDSHSDTAGDLTITLGSRGTTANTFNVDVSDLGPGESAYRIIDVTLGSSLDFGSASLAVTGSGNNALTTDATNGLKITVQRCSVAWTQSGTSPNYTYACSGGTSYESITQRAVANFGTAQSLRSGADGANGFTLTAGAVNHLRMQITLGTVATSTSLQNVSTTLTFAFSGTQRTGVAK
jgi:hypothetical protein